MHKKKVPVITIDGPSGTGKGTVCHKLAEHLKWHALDSGALYRVLAFAAEKRAVDFTDVGRLVELTHTLDLRFEGDLEHGSRVFLDEEDIGQKIRTEHYGQAASKIGVLPEVRLALLARQRAFAISPGLVTDGRDMGTVVFPEAILKIFLYADTEERAKRRYLQLKRSENNVSLAQLVAELSSRDARDTARQFAPLKPAHDAISIDTTSLSVIQVFDKVLQLVNEECVRLGIEV